MSAAKLSPWAQKMRHFQRQKRVVHRVYAFGDNSAAQCGLGTRFSNQTPISPCEIEVFSQSDALIGQISTSWQHCFAVEKVDRDKRARVWSWGTLEGGATMHLGRPGKTVPLPEYVDALKTYNIGEVCCGRLHSIARTVEGDIIFAGATDLGQSGMGIEGEHKTIPAPEKLLSGELKGKKIVQIKSGLDHILALAESGEVYSWGYGKEGQLGHGTDDIEDTPRRIGFFDGIHVDQIETGFDTSFARSSDGRWFAWGNNDHGQMGLGSSDAQLIPTEMVFLRNKDVLSLKSGACHTVVLTTKGDVYICGWGQDGRLGLGKEKTDKVVNFELLESLSKLEIDIVSCGGGHTLAGSTKNKVIYSWGFGFTGRLGHGDQETQYIPKPIEDLIGQKPHLLACGLDHSLVVCEVTQAEQTE